MATRYESYASSLGVKFPSRKEQEEFGSGSTDQGNVTYEVPSIHPMFKLDLPEGVGNHTPGFTEVLGLDNCGIIFLGCQVERSTQEYYNKLKIIGFCCNRFSS